MWFTPCSRRSSSVRSASAWETEASAAAPKIVRVLSWPVFPNGAVAITVFDRTSSRTGSAQPAADELAKKRLELPTPPREPVLDGGRPRIEYAPLEHTCVDELRQARRQRGGRNASERLAKLVEARCAFDRCVEDRQGPAPFEEVRRAADVLGNRVTPPAAQGPAPARARARAPRRR